MNEIIIKASQSATLLAKDLIVMNSAACNPGRPEGMSLGDAAVSELTMTMIRQAREIEAVLFRLSFQQPR